mgnify:CR=1 FL=1
MLRFIQNLIIGRSPVVKAYDKALTRMRSICKKLEKKSNSNLTDSHILNAYESVRNQAQSNCDSIAQGLFTIVAGICAHRPHLAPKILPDPLQSLYYLGIEDLDGIKNYIIWLIGFDEPYLGRATQSGYQYLHELTEQDSVLTEAFRVMFSKEDNEWRKDEKDLPSIPKMLQTNE